MIVSDFSYEEDDDLTVAFLMSLIKFYDKYMSKSPEYILKHLKEDIKSLKSDLLDDLHSYDYESIIDTIKEKHSFFEEFAYDVSDTLAVAESTLEAIINQLYDDILIKCKVFMDQGNNVEDFSIKSNYNKSIKRLKDTSNYFNGMVYQKSERALLNEVYGGKQLYTWVCYGPSPCAWCVEQSKLPPRPLDEIPFDHINGYCGVEPVV